MQRDWSFMYSDREAIAASIISLNEPPQTIEQWLVLWIVLSPFTQAIRDRRLQQTSFKKNCEICFLIEETMNAWSLYLKCFSSSLSYERNGKSYERNGKSWMRVKTKLRPSWEGRRASEKFLLDHLEMCWTWQNWQPGGTLLYRVPSNWAQ